MLGAPEVDAGLQVRSHLSRLEGQNLLPRPAGHAAFDAAQDTVGLLGCDCTLSGHVELLINQHLYVLLLSAALNQFSPKPVLVLLYFSIFALCVAQARSGFLITMFYNHPEASVLCPLNLNHYNPQCPLTSPLIKNTD